MKSNFKHITALLLFVMFFIAPSCIEKFIPDLGDFEPSRLIVVEGQITDEEGPFRVKISKAFEIDNMQLYPPPVNGADVQIFDDKGNHYQLYSTVEGWYETENKQLKGIAGNTYTLNITTEDGSQFESSPVFMLDVPDIGKLYFEESQIERLEDLEVVRETRLDILLDAKDTKGETEYWKWDFEETWEVRTPKDSVRIPVQPDDALGFIIVANVEFKDGNLSRNWDNKKERCWVTVPSTTILIESTDKKSVDEVEKFPINSISPKGDRLHIKYSILAKQTALSEEMYNFWKRLREANEEVGSMFDKTPSQIFGNIQCCNGKQKALGYFSASAVKNKRIFINPSEHDVETMDAYSGCLYNFYIPRVANYYLGHIVSVGDPNYASAVGQKIYSTEPWCADCREYGTSVKPDFWED